MQLFHSYHHHKIGKLMHSGFWLFELSDWFHVFARSMIAIFIPIILLELGYSIGNIMVFYMIYMLFDIPLNFVAKWLTKKLGARRVLIIGILSLIGNFTILYNLQPNSWPMLVLLALFAAFYDTFYWVPHLFFFMKVTKHDKNVSKDTSILYIVKKVAGMLAPALGAIILVFFGNKALIPIAILILFASIIPLLKIKDIDDMPKKKDLSMKQFFSSWDITKDYVRVGFQAIHGSGEAVLFPLFTYLLLETVESVASIAVIVSIATIIFTYYSGRVKKEHRASTIAFAALLICLTWVGRVFVENTIFIYLSVFLVGFFSVFISVPLDSNLMEKGVKKNPLSASTYRNTVSMFAKFCLYATLSLSINIFQVSFISAAICMFLVMLISSFALPKSSRA